MEIDDQLDVPEFFDMFDVRRPAKQYVDDKLAEILKEVFEIRLKLEKTFSRNELLAYDRILIRHLTMENLIPKIKNAITTDLNTLTQMSHGYDQTKEGEEENELRQFMKYENK